MRGFDDTCRGKAAQKILDHFEDSGTRVCTVLELARVLGRSPRYARSIVSEHPAVFKVGMFAALRRDDQVSLRRGAE